MLVKVVTMLRLLAFMVVVYVGLALLAERKIQKPDSKVKAFFRILCLPVTGVVSRTRMIPKEAGYPGVLAASLGLAAAVWVMLIIVDEVFVRP